MPEGQIISQDPKAGTSVKRGVAVSVVVSKGRQPITVPDVVGARAERGRSSDHQGRPQAGARRRRQQRHRARRAKSSRRRPARARLFRGDTVTIVVSKGPVMVQVPGVVGRPVAEAEKALTGLGFTVQKDYPFGTLFDLVRVQSIDGGQQAPKGSTIILTIV